MNPLHIHDIVDTLKEAIPRPLEIEGHCSGSDPTTHKKIREEANKPPSNISSVQSTSTTIPSSPIDRPTKLTDISEQHSKLS